MAIRLILAEDSYLVREGIARLLGTQPEVSVVATCNDLDSLLAAVQSEQPDVVLTDIRMPPARRDEGIEAARRLRDRWRLRRPGGASAADRAVRARG